MSAKRQRSSSSIPEVKPVITKGDNDPRAFARAFARTKASVSVTLHYHKNDGTAAPYETPFKIEVVPCEGQKIYVPKYKTINVTMSVDGARTFEEFWAKIVPVDYVPMNMLDSDTPLLDFCTKPFNIRHDPEEYATRKARLDEVRKAVNARAITDYMAFLETELESARQRLTTVTTIE